MKIFYLIEVTIFFIITVSLLVYIMKNNKYKKQIENKIINSKQELSNLTEQIKNERITSNNQELKNLKQQINKEKTTLEQNLKKLEQKFNEFERNISAREILKQESNKSSK